MEVAPVAQAHSPAVVHPYNVLTGPLGVCDHSEAVLSLPGGGVLDSNSLADVEGGEAVRGSVVSGLHALHVAGHVSFPMPKVVTPIPADEVMAFEGGQGVPQLASGQHLGW